MPAVVVMALLGAIAETAGCSGGPDGRVMAGAQQIGLDDEGSGIPYAGRSIDDLPFNDRRVALDVTSDGHGGLWLLSAGELAHFDRDGLMDARRDLPLPHGAAGSLAVAADGSAVHGSVLPARLGADPRAVAAGAPGYEFGVRWTRSLPELPFRVASVSYSPDGSLLVSSLDDATIVAVDPDGSMRHVMGPGGGAEAAGVQLDAPVRTSIVGLPDGRIAFATNAIDGEGDSDGEVYLIDGDGLRRVETTSDRLIRRIFPGPDGTLLALDGRNISQLDPDTGGVEVLVTLDDIDYAEPPGPSQDPWIPTRRSAAPEARSLEPAASSGDLWLEGRIGATADGDDLVFTAGNRLWRLEDAFAPGLEQRRGRQRPGSSRDAHGARTRDA